MSDDRDDWGNWPPPLEPTPVPAAVDAEAEAPVAAPTGSEPAEARRFDRRVLLAGAGALGLGAVGIALAQMGGDDDGGSNPTTTPALVDRPAQLATSPVADAATPDAATPIEPAAATPDDAAATPGDAAMPAAEVAALPDGMVLVASPRLPLFGIGPDEVAPLLAGSITDWRQVGSAVSLPVERLALTGAAAPLASPAATAADYAALATELDARLGGLALVAPAEVDYRVNVLSIGTSDPLREAAYPGAEPLVRIGIVGDIVPGRNVHLRMLEYGDFQRPFRSIGPHLAAYDLTIANLEGNLSASLPQPVDSDPNTFTFVSDPAMIDGFKLAGIDVVTLANNHSVWNEPEVGWGVQGLLDTLDALDAASFAHFGAGRTLADARAPWITEVNGVRIALIGVDAVTANYEVEPGVQTGVVDFDAGAGAETAGTNPWLSSQFLEDIAAATAQADVVIPYFHGGVEYVSVPPRWLVDGAHAAIDAGATMVVTNHPHVIGCLETYNGRPIVYSPGNFIFDQMFSVEVRSGFVLDLTLRGDRVVGLRCHGVEIQDFHQPRLMTAGEHAGLMDRFWSTTDRLAGGEFG